MKKILFAAAILSFSSTVVFADEIQISKPTDKDLTCEQITTEISEMNAIIDEGKSDETTAHAANVGASVAGHAIMSSGGGIFGAIVSHAGSLANIGAGDREQRMKDAETRINVLNGISIGKGCIEQPIAPVEEE